MPCGATVIVVDASVLAAALIDDGEHGEVVRGRLRGEVVCGPELLDLEVLSVLRGRTAAGHLLRSRARQALDDLGQLPIRRCSHIPFLGRCWELRDNLTVYDAAYVALAELLDVPLVTADVRLSRATGPRCRIELLSAAS